LNALAPPKQKRAPAKSALQTAKLRVAYHAVAFLTKAFGEPFWFWEQKRGHLLDRIDNENDYEGNET
jgi:hypothetical protein